MKLKAVITTLLRVRNKRNLSGCVLLARDISKLKSKQSLRVKHHSERLKKTLPNNRKSRINPLISLWIFKQNDCKVRAKIFNLKQMAQTVNFLQEHKLLAYTDLEEKAKKCTATFDELNTQIKSAEKRIAEIQALKKHIFNYTKTRDIYTDYRKADYSKKFYEEHRAELTLHKAAKAAFKELWVKKLPTIKALQAECDELFSLKNKAYSKYHIAEKKCKIF